MFINNYLYSIFNYFEKKSGLITSDVISFSVTKCPILLKFTCSIQSFKQFFRQYSDFLTASPSSWFLSCLMGVAAVIRHWASPFLCTAWHPLVCINASCFLSLGLFWPLMVKYQSGPFFHLQQCSQVGLSISLCCSVHPQLWLKTPECVPTCFFIQAPAQWSSPTSTLVLLLLTLASLLCGH